MTEMSKMVCTIWWYDRLVHTCDGGYMRGARTWAAMMGDSCKTCIWGRFF